MKCTNCEYNCELSENWSGICNMYRVNDSKIENRFYSEYLISEFYRTWIESVPMFHFMPGIVIINVGTISCNFDCKYCLNERLARVNPSNSERINLYPENPERLLRRAKLGGARAIVFGENEPAVSMNYVLDLAKECHKNNVPFGISTNGFMTTKALNPLLEEGIDIVNFDIKSFNPQFLKDIIGIKGKLAEEAKNIFLRNLKIINNDANVKMLEVNTPVLHNMNSFEIVDIAKEIANISKKIPYHVQRVVPEYQYKDPNPNIGQRLDTKEYYQEIKEMLDYAYFGAFPNSPHVDTYCPNCKKLLIKRADHGGCQCELLTNALTTNRCPNCKEEINIILP